KITPAMAQAIDETNRRREKQIAYNTERGLDPQPLRKKINDIVATIAREEVDTEQLLGTGYRQAKGAKAPVPTLGIKAGSGKAKGDGAVVTDRPATELAGIIEEMTDRMRAAAADLQFEVAARLRDEVGELKKELRQMREAGLA
ncbi:UvrB/UvrC motif-containing protein, partial [Streptomyces sp. NPDC059814]